MYINFSFAGLGGSRAQGEIYYPIVQTPISWEQTNHQKITKWFPAVLYDVFSLVYYELAPGAKVGLKQTGIRLL